MKMAYHDDCTGAIIKSIQGRTAQAAFFNDRGSAAQNTLAGLLHGILYQMLVAPELTASLGRALAPAAASAWDTYAASPDAKLLSLEVLKSSF